MKILIIGLYIALVEILNGIDLDNIDKSIYWFIRIWLSISYAFLIPVYIKSQKQLRDFLIVICISVFVTLGLVILSSLPETRVLTIKYFFSNKFIEPGSEKVIEWMKWYGSNGARGRSLVGICIISGYYICILLSIGLFLLQETKKILLKYFVLFLWIIFPFGIVLTYSRGVLLSYILLIVAAFYFKINSLIRLASIFIITGAVAFFLSNWDNHHFLLNRYSVRFNEAINNQSNNKMESERYLAYSEPFYHLVENPIFLIFGNGYARAKMDKIGIYTSGINFADHAVFARAYHGYGLVVAILYCSIFIQAFRIAKKTILVARTYKLRYTEYFSKYILISLFSCTPWFLFGHAIVSFPIGASLFFFLIGMVRLQRKVLMLEYYGRK